MLSLDCIVTKIEHFNLLTLEQPRFFSRFVCQPVSCVPHWPHVSLIKNTWIYLSWSFSCKTSIFITLIKNALRLKQQRSQRKQIREMYLCLDKTTSGYHICQNSATMGTEGHNLTSSLVISIYMVYLLSTPIWYMTRLNHALQWAGLSNLYTFTLLIFASF